MSAYGVGTKRVGGRVGEGLSVTPGVVFTNLNSGAALINLVVQWGVSGIVLLGYDFQRGPNGETHVHGDHEGGLPNLGTMTEWVARMRRIGGDLSALGVRVANASRRTAIDCFERLPLTVALERVAPERGRLLVQGMSGLGDNLHQRAVVKELAKKDDVWIMTPWPQVYLDIPGVKFLPIASQLRTQAKNEDRSSKYYTTPPQGGRVRVIGLSYSPQKVKAVGSVMGAIAATAGVPQARDFRMVVPEEWKKASEKFVRTRKPILVYRPLVTRTEWGGSSTRNPDGRAYAELANAARRGFYTVSLADFVEGVEWESGVPIETDAQFHRGELSFEVLAGLFARASLAFSCPGFAVVLAQAVGTPAVTVFGGYEDATSFAVGGELTPWLAIEPVRPCPCWTHDHGCDKRIDLGVAKKRVAEFASLATTYRRDIN